MYSFDAIGRLLLAFILILGVFVSGCETSPADPYENPFATSAVLCTTHADCCNHTPSSICVSPGRCESNIYCAQDPNCWIYRWGACNGSNPNPRTTTDTTSSGVCRTFAANVQVQSRTNQCAGTRGPYTEENMDLLNEFWGSNMYACPCSQQVPMCSGNAYFTSQTPGYIYYDVQLFEKTLRSGSKLPAAWIMSHEVGHNLQFKIGTQATYTIQHELGADCYSGFFLGWLVCTGRVNQYDINAALSQVCSWQDPEGVPWFDKSAHGTCTQRINAVMKGVSGYQSGQMPSLTCVF